MTKQIASTMIFLLLSALPAVGAELVLEDGTLLRGTALERVGELYHLRLETGNVLPIPVTLVREVRLQHKDAVDEAPAAEPDPEAEPETEVEPEPEPERPRASKEPVLQPRLPEPGGPSAQNAAITAGIASFARAPVNPHHELESDYREPGVNEFDPSRWYRSTVDPDWLPEPTLDPEDDISRVESARWYRSTFGKTWRPTDGFQRDE